MWFFSILASIFLDKNHRNITPDPKNLTEHYHTELQKANFLDEVCIGIHYREIEESITRFKYDSRREHAVELSHALVSAEKVSTLFAHYDDWVIVPVPMHWSRYIFRGFHHTHFLAKELSEILHLPLKNLLSSQYRARQSQLGRKMRLENKKNSFRMRNPKEKASSHIIIIDDVISSGATASECAKILKSHGADIVIGWFVTSNNP